MAGIIRRFFRRSVQPYAQSDTQSPQPRLVTFKPGCLTSNKRKVAICVSCSHSHLSFLWLRAEHVKSFRFSRLFHFHLQSFDLKSFKMTETMQLRGTLRGHNGWVTQIATNPIHTDMILSCSRGKHLSTSLKIF